jgi:hypothetical protein
MGTQVVPAQSSCHCQLSGSSRSQLLAECWLLCLSVQAGCAQAMARPGGKGGARRVVLNLWPCCAVLCCEGCSCLCNRQSLQGLVAPTLRVPRFLLVVCDWPVADAVEAELGWRDTGAANTLLQPKNRSVPSSWRLLVVLGDISTVCLCSGGLLPHESHSHKDTACLRTHKNTMQGHARAPPQTPNSSSSQHCARPATKQRHSTPCHPAGPPQQQLIPAGPSRAPKAPPA